MHVNNDYQRNANLSRVFETVWKNPNFSRIDIARKLELYRSTVSNIIGTLVDSGLICEGERGEATEKGGRKPVFLSVNPSFGCVIGIEIQLDSFHVAVVSFDGTTIFEDDGPTPVNQDLLDKPEELFVFMIDSIIKMIAPEINDNPVRPLAISVGLPGIIDVDSGIIKRSAPFRLDNFNYSQALGNRYGIPLFMENDARCCSWLQLALNKASDKKDFLCVLARNYAGNPLLTYPESYGKGIGVGLSITMNGRVINGRNYGVGEYISRSWTTYQKGQTGLPEAVLKTVDSVDDSYAEWVKDLFGTLTMMVPLLEPETVFVHGQPAYRRDFLLEVVEKNVPQFTSIMKSCGSELVIMDDNAFGISKGAALMCIQKLYEVQMLEGKASKSVLKWDDLFELHRKSEDKSLLKI
ncbi:ROK family transcriptional regulator [Treponema bryantii]|uniref:ROK family transcriptional regulator n=1 Tax=Treponema bryantii TaxID=163 RepID=UPI0003B32085|nr:ROK family transcriptional regulator [Treponema bryantii]